MISTSNMDATNQAPLKMKLKKEIIQEILKFASTQELQSLQQINPTGMTQDIIENELQLRLQRKNFNPQTNATTLSRKD